MIRVFLVEDHILFRHALHLVIEDQPDVEVVGEAALGREAIARIPQVEVDVVVCDYNLPDIDGLEVTHLLLRQRKELRILILSGIDHGPIPKQLISAGALGYVTKGGNDGGKVLRAIREVAAGRRYWDEVLCFPDSALPTPFDRLSPRMSQVAMLTIRGLTISEVAQAANMSESAVRTQRQLIFLRLNVKNDIGLLRLAQRYGLMPDESGDRNRGSGEDTVL